MDRYTIEDEADLFFSRVQIKTKKIILLNKALKDYAEDEVEAREIAKRVLPANVVDGDTFYVPSIAEVVGKLVTLIEEMRPGKS